MKYSTQNPNELNTVTFHPMLPDDRRFLEDMMLNLYSNDGEDGNDYMNRDQVRRTLDRAITHPDNLKVEVFKTEEQVVGYALLYSFWSNEYGGLVLTLDELYILPLFRNRGISSSYIQSLQGKADAYVLLALEVMPGNDRAKALYSRLGFTENKRTFMNKKLN